MKEINAFVETLSVAKVYQLIAQCHVVVTQMKYVVGRGLIACMTRQLIWAIWVVLLFINVKLKIVKLYTFFNKM
jgi:hypothetical protein